MGRTRQICSAGLALDPEIESMRRKRWRSGSAWVPRSGIAKGVSAVGSVGREGRGTGTGTDTGLLLDCFSTSEVDS